MSDFFEFEADFVESLRGIPMVASELAIDPEPPWLNDLVIPDSVMEKAESVGVALLGSQWATLDPLRRFALIKLSRSNHENTNFRPALEEFGLV